MTYKFWRNAAALSAIVGSVGIAGYAVAAPNYQPSMLAGNGQNRASYQGMENGRHLGWNNNAPRAQLHTPEQREQILAAVKAGNYEQWKSLVAINGEIPKQFQAITADNFAKFAEMHTAMEAKDFDRANVLRQELGLTGMGQGNMRRGNMNRAQLHTPEQREQILAAVKAGNYEQWKSLVAINGEIPKQFQAITADNFAKFAEMHTAMEANDFDRANALRQELGLTGMGSQKMGAKHGLGQGRGNR